MFTFCVMWPRFSQPYKYYLLELKLRYLYKLLSFIIEFIKQFPNERRNTKTKSYFNAYSSFLDASSINDYFCQRNN